MSCTKTSPYGATGRRISLWKTQPGDIGEEPHPCMPTVFPFGVLGEALVRARERPTRRARPGHGSCATTVLYGGGGGAATSSKDATRRRCGRNASCVTLRPAASGHEGTGRSEPEEREVSASGLRVQKLFHVGPRGGRYRFERRNQATSGKNLVRWSPLYSASGAGRSRR